MPILLAHISSSSPTRACERSATGTALLEAAESASAVRKLRAKRKGSSVVVNSSTEEHGDQHAVCTRPASYDMILYSRYRISVIRTNSGARGPNVEGDTSGCGKPPVDIKSSVLSWPSQNGTVILMSTARYLYRAGALDAPQEMEGKQATAELLA